MGLEVKYNNIITDAMLKINYEFHLQYFRVGPSYIHMSMGEILCLNLGDLWFLNYIFLFCILSPSLIPLISQLHSFLSWSSSPVVPIYVLQEVGSKTKFQKKKERENVKNILLPSKFKLYNFKKMCIWNKILGNFYFNILKIKGRDKIKWR